jgi:hypothetical protein
MKVRVVVSGLAPPLADKVYALDSKHDVPEEVAIDWLNKNWAIAEKESQIEHATAAAQGKK